MNMFNASACALSTLSSVGAVVLVLALLLIVAAAAYRIAARQNLTQTGKEMETEFNNEGETK